ncbi:OSCP-domain-containing protein [Rhizodiscina lignyota]|uniref:ATP synthase subunit 5, mitochondrial n=1 Tax=Rhizodiscina lignyota TaxID=1504668 RepID=A0A9P4M7I7_9PEZI|nr:OSCP-domain-containing protein [Rhizodiscina lignyota]
MLSRRAIAQAARIATPRAPIAPRTVFRSYAAAASDVIPPVELYGVDGTYATALWTASAKTSALDSTARSVESLNGLFKRDPKLQNVLSAPTLTVGDKQKIVAELLKGVTQDKGDIMKNLLGTLAEHNRLNALKAVCEKYAELVSAHRGEVELTVTSAAPLEPKVLQKLESAVTKSSYVGQGKKLKVVSKVNPDIRGGLIVEIGDRTIDLSVSSKMAKMNKLLTETL